MGGQNGFVETSIMRNVVDAKTVNSGWTAGSSNFYNIERPLLFCREFGMPSLKKNLKAHQAVYIYRSYKQYGKSFA